MDTTTWNICSLKNYIFIEVNTCILTVTYSERLIYGINIFVYAAIYICLTCVNLKLKVTYIWIQQHIS